VSRRRRSWPWMALLWTAAVGAFAADRYQPVRRVAPSLEPILRHLKPGEDAFPEEKVAEELAGRLQELGALLRQDPSRAPAAAVRLLAADFKGGRLTPGAAAPRGHHAPLEVVRSPALSQALDRDRNVFSGELATLVQEFRTIRTAELLITAIQVEPGPTPRARTAVRYDIVGNGPGAWRAERVGRWRMEWRREAGGWRIAEWAALEDVSSRASQPVFTEVTAAALRDMPTASRQLAHGLDHWSARLDGVFRSGGMGHHGVSVGDADGDGLDDLYVSQPAGLPNRLFRARGDATFEDVTEASGLAVLDGTSQSLFADTDNDGDQDLVLVSQAGLLLFANDGKGRFARVPDAFRAAAALKGSPTSVAMADYDRDGLLDVYLCTYSYVIGATEDKAGTAIPYHDATNGPPNLLFRNDGQGRFVDVTAEAGLGQGNDRFSFAAAWADYDEDGWPDLLVANDFGRKNLYRNLGPAGGRVRFQDVAAEAGVEDVGAGMSATFLDYDNDGRLDIYAGNMWTAAGQRVTGTGAFLPEAPADVRALYRRHTRGNSLFRNLGGGRFEDVTLAARAEMGRWAWSSDALDFDSDGWDDLYVVNGMFTRDGGGADLDSFFWRQVVARSPLTLSAGTPFDDAWRATNRLLMADASQAAHERNVLLRNDGRGGYDEVSGTAGLDLDQDGRSFAVFDPDRDGDPDLVLMAARSSPQLRLFRNDFAGRGAVLALRLLGTRGNRDAVGARVTLETDLLRRTRVVQAGSGFLSQHSKELLFGLGGSQRVLKATVQWPGGQTQVFTDLPIGRRILIEEGKEAVRAEALQPPSTPGKPEAAASRSAGGAPVDRDSWLYRPFPAPDFTLRGSDGREHSLVALRGRPAALLFWSTSAGPSPLDVAHALAAGGLQVLALSVDPPRAEGRVRAASRSVRVPVLMAADVAGAWSILHRFAFDLRQDLPLPVLFLLDAHGQVVKVYRDPRDPAGVLADVPRIEASAAERLARALPFPGTFQAVPGERNYFPYSLDLAEQGFEAVALTGFERAASLDPSPITSFNLGTLYMKAGRPAEARTALESALERKPAYAEASNTLGALLAQGDDLEGAIPRFRAALETRPDFPDALNNLGYALYQTGLDQEAHDLYQRALLLQPDFPEAHNNLGIYFGQQGDLERAESYFRKAVEHRRGYGEAANNLALVLAARGDEPGAIGVLQQLLKDDPASETAYLGLSRIHVQAGRTREGIQALERLLQKNPKHPLGLEMLRKLRE
jgi:tetratricopeptide (TPR) repeat protein